MSAAERLLEKNRSYAKSFDEGRLPMPPARRVAVVACMDARLDVYRLLGLELGDAHVIRNAGGVVTEDAIRSLVISQRLLGTREIVLIHHTDCGMLTFEDDDVKRQIEADVGVRPSFALEAFPDVEADIRQSIRRLRESPFLQHKDAVRGFVYDVKSGRLIEVNSP
jgi:carbonic anhydrase